LATSTLTRAACAPSQDLAVSLLTHAIDGLAQAWTDDTLHLLQAFAKHGASTRRSAAWTGQSSLLDSSQLARTPSRSSDL